MQTIIIWFAILTAGNGGVEMPLRLVFATEQDCTAFIDKTKSVTSANRGNTVNGVCLSAKVIDTLPKK